MLVFFFFCGVYPNNFFSRKKNVPGCGKQTYFSIQSLSLPCRVPIQTHAKVSIYNIDRERWSEWLFKHYVICLCVKWRADTWTWWWWFGAAWVPLDGSRVMGPFCIYGRAHVTASTDHLLYCFPAFLFGATDAPCSVQFSACPRIRVS